MKREQTLSPSGVRNHRVFAWKRFFLFVCYCLCMSIGLYASPAYPGYVDFRLPDGSVIKVKIMGDEDLRWAETEDGYTLLFDEDGFLVYAENDPDGNLVPTKVRATDARHRPEEVKARLQKVGKQAMFSESQVSKANEVKKARSLEMQKVSGAKGSVVGVRKNLVILVDFPDLPFTQTVAKFETLLNSEHPSDMMPYGASVRDYYREASFGQLDLQTKVVGVYRMPKPMAYYGGNSGSTDTHAREMIQEAISQADADVNFADYDNDGDGRVDGIHVIYAGYGEEAGGGSDCVWAHASSVSGSYDGVFMGRYSCSPELRGNSGKNITHIGVICHETGHVLGTMDFYDTNYGVDGSYPSTGEWDIMSQGSWNGAGACPAFFNPYSVIYDFGWAEPIDGNKPSCLSLTHHDKNSYVRINTPTEGEYFLLEYRNNRSFDIAVPGHGLMIYRASENLSRKVYNRINACHPQQFYPLSANAKSDIPTSDPNSYGVVNTESCPFPGSLGVTEIADYTVPSMKTWTGVETGLPITKIEEDLGMNAVTFDIAGGDYNGAYDIHVIDCGSDFVSLEWKTTNENATMMLVYGMSPSFGTPAGNDYQLGDTIPGGGEVLSIGTSLSYKHENLADRTDYYYIVYTWDEQSQDWRSSAIKRGRTITGVIRNFPFIEDFQSQAIDGAWQQEELKEGGEWLIRNDQIGNSYNYYLSFNTYKTNSSVQNDEILSRMILPVMDFTGHEKAFLSFVYTNGLSYARVMYRRFSNDEWKLICYLEDSSTFLCELPNLSSEYQLCLESYYSAYDKGYSTSNECINIDDIVVSVDASAYIETKLAERIAAEEVDIPVYVVEGSERIISKGVSLSEDGISWNEYVAGADGICRITGLERDTEYYYRSFATTERGTVFGNTNKLKTMPFDCGKGTLDNPFLIQSAEDWMKLSTEMLTQRLHYYVGSKFNYYQLKDLHFRLTEDISIPGNKSYFTTFKAKFDCDNHTINLVLDENIKSCRFFSTLAEDAEFKNARIRLVNENIELGNSLIAAYNTGIIDNCRLEIIGKSTAPVSFGACAELNSGTITNCHVVCNGSESTLISGITNSNSGVISHCSFSGANKGMQNGIAHSNYGIITCCVNYAEMEGGCAISGGNYGRVEQCVNYGTMKSFGVGLVYNGYGGIVKDCYNMGHYIPNGDQNKLAAVSTGPNGSASNVFFGGTIEGDFFNRDFDTWSYRAYPTMEHCYVLYNNHQNEMLSYWEGDLNVISYYDLESQDFVDSLNAHTENNPWVLSGGRVHLKMESDVPKDWMKPSFNMHLALPDIRTDRATISVSVLGGALYNLLSYGLEWKEENDSEWTEAPVQKQSSFTQTMLGLRPFHIYHYRAYAKDIKGRKYESEEKVLATLYEEFVNPEDTLYLDNLYDLRTFAQTLSQNIAYQGKIVVLTTDIDLCGNREKKWQPMVGKFMGEFDGGGHFINNMYVETLDGDAGFWGKASGCRIHDLHIRNSVVKSNVAYTSDGHSTSQGVGGIIGFDGSIISNCSFEGSIVGGNSVGAIAGTCGRVENCYSKCDILAGITSGPWIGRIAGNGDVKDSYFAGTRFNQTFERDIVGYRGNVENSYYLSNKTEKNKMTEEDMKSGVLLSRLPDEYWMADDPEHPINGGFPILRNQSESRLSTLGTYVNDFGETVLSALYVKGASTHHVTYGFEWFSQADNLLKINRVHVSDPDSFQLSLVNIPSGINHYYRAFAATESNDTIFGQWVAFEKQNPNPIPYITRVAPVKEDGTVHIMAGLTPGDERITRLTLEYHPVDNPDGKKEQEISELPNEIVLGNLLPHIFYSSVLCAYTQSGSRYESKPAVWLSPLFGVQKESGDANADTRVSLADIVSIVDAIHGVEAASFNSINADVYEDGYINTLDVMSLKDTLLMSTCLPESGMEQKGEIEVTSDVIDLSATPQVTIGMKNMVDATAFRLELVVPTDMKIKDIRLVSENSSISHQLYWERNNDAVRIVSFSLRNDTVTCTGDAPLSHVIVFFESDPLTYYAELPVTIQNAMFVDTAGREYQLQCNAALIAVDDPCLIDGIYYYPNYKGEMEVAPLRVGTYSGDIVIPDSVLFKGERKAVTSIRSNSFSSNKDIRSIKVPGSIKECTLTCSDCIGVKQILFSEGIEQLKVRLSNTSITELNIPSTVKYIEGMVRGTQFNNDFHIGYMPLLEKFVVSPESPYFQSIDGVLYTKDGRILVKCPPTKTGTFVVPEHVDTVGYNAFDEDSKLNLIVMNENVKLIGNFGFGENTSVIIYGDRVPTLLKDQSVKCKQTFVPEAMIEAYMLSPDWRYKPLIPISQTDLVLKKGWNWVTLSYISQETCDLSCLSNAADAVQTVVSQTQALINDPILGWVGNLDFRPEQCYKVYADGDVQIPLVGGYCDYSKKKRVTLYPGWNWLPYWTSTPLSINDAIVSKFGIVGGLIILGQDEFAIYENSGWQGAFMMQPGHGYMAYMPRKSSSWTMEYNYIAPEEATTSSPEVPAPSHSYWTYDAHAFASTMPVIAQVMGAPNPNYDVAAMVGDECRGVSRSADGRRLVAVHGEAGEKIGFHVLDRMSGTVYEANESCSFGTELVGSFAEPLMLTLGKVIGHVDDVTSLDFVKDNEQYDVYDMSGLRILKNASREQIDKLPKGIYVVNGRKIMKYDMIQIYFTRN